MADILEHRIVKAWVAKLGKLGFRVNFYSCDEHLFWSDWHILSCRLGVPIWKILCCVRHEGKQYDTGYYVLGEDPVNWGQVFHKIYNAFRCL